MKLLVAVAALAAALVAAPPAGAGVNVFIGSPTVPVSFQPVVTVPLDATGGLPAPSVTGGSGSVTANLWVDSGAGACTRRSTAVDYSGSATGTDSRCGTVATAYAAAAAGDQVGVRPASYGDITFTNRSLGQPAVSFFADSGTVGFGVLGLQGTDNVRFVSRAGHRDWSGAQVTANTDWFTGSQCRDTRNVAFYGLTLSQSFQDEKAVSLMCAGVAWTFRNIDICCTFDDKIVNFDNWLAGGQTTDIVMEQGAIHSQVISDCPGDPGCPVGDEVHSECLWALGVQSMVMRGIHWFGCKSGSGDITISTNGDALEPANIAFENNTFDQAVDDTGSTVASLASFDPDGAGRAWLGVNFIRNNFFEGEDGSSFAPAPSGSTITWANNLGAGPQCGGTVNANNRWSNANCGGTNTQDTSAFSSGRYVDAPKAGRGANTQAASQIVANWHSVTGAAQIDAGSNTHAPGYDADMVARPVNTTADQGPYEFNGTPGANEPPTANFITPVAGTGVSFDASSSLDPDGTIATYRWDWNYTGSGACQADSSPSTATTTHTVATGDIVCLQVVDDGGALSGQKIVQIL